MSTSDRKKRLQELQEKKFGKNKSNDEAVYDEVNEEDYRKHARDRVLYDDFVVDDNGEGYADTGEYEWDGQNQYYSDDDGEEPRDREPQPKKNKKQKTNEPSKPNKDVSQLFRAAAAAKPTNAPKPKQVSLLLFCCTTFSCFEKY